jgi:hypothetical protein
MRDARGPALDVQPHPCGRCGYVNEDTIPAPSVPWRTRDSLEIDLDLDARLLEYLGDAPVHRDDVTPIVGDAEFDPRGRGDYLARTTIRPPRADDPVDADVPADPRETDLATMGLGLRSANESATGAAMFTPTEGALEADLDLDSRLLEYLRDTYTSASVDDVELDWSSLLL